MRELSHECWSSCDGCDRQVPSLDEKALERLGWATFVGLRRRLHFCPTCVESNPDVQRLQAPEEGVRS